MNKTHREWNPHKEAWEEWTWDSSAQEFTIKSTFDVTSIIQANKQMANASLDGRFGNEAMHHVAEIPNVFIVKFKKEHNLDIFSSDPSEQKRLRRLLELPEYRFLKTTVSKLWRPT